MHGAGSVRRAAVFRTPGTRPSLESPGTLVLRLEPRWRNTCVFDAASREVGIVRSEGVIRGVRFVMRRSGGVVWSSSVRSIVRKDHRVNIAGREDWTFDTPFFWWHHYFIGTANGQTESSDSSARPRGTGVSVSSRVQTRRSCCRAGTMYPIGVELCDSLLRARSSMSQSAMAPIFRSGSVCRSHGSGRASSRFV